MKKLISKNGVYAGNQPNMPTQQAAGREGKMKRSQKIEYGPNYTVFLGLMERAENGMSRGETFVKSLTMQEIRLLNGYEINTGDDEIHIRQTYDLNGVTFGSKNATYRLGAYCMELDKRCA